MCEHARGPKSKPTRFKIIHAEVKVLFRTDITGPSKVSMSVSGNIVWANPRELICGQFRPIVGLSAVIAESSVCVVYGSKACLRKVELWS